MGTVNKTPTIPSTMLTSLARQRDERERFVYSHASKLKDAPLTGLPKMLLEQFGELAQRIEAQMRNEQEEQRFRSFVERYIIEVASKFNDPLKDGFNAICDGKAIYKMIYNAAHDYRPQQETGAMGAVGASMPSQPPSVATTHNDLQAAYEMGVLIGKYTRALPDAPSGTGNAVLRQSTAQRLYNAVKGKYLP